MKRITLTICAAVLLLYACNNETKSETTKDSTDTLDNKKEEAWVPVDSAKAMQDMIAAGTPGSMHQMMASWNGTWTGETTMWEKPGGPPMKSTGTAVNSMALGGRYQTAKHTGEVMGMPFEGISTVAYDNTRKVFVSSWIDNWNTQIMHLTGPWDEATKTMTLSGNVADPSRPGKECSIRETLKIIDDNNQLMEMYGPDPATGKEYKMMEIKLTRKK